MLGVDWVSATWCRNSGLHSPAYVMPCWKSWGTHQVLIRPLGSKTGFTAVREQRGAEENEYQPLFSARIIEGRDDPFFSVTSEETFKVLEAYRKHVGRLTAQQVSSALVNVVSQLGGTRLRPTGGVYWLAGDRIADWEDASEAVAQAADGGKSVAYVVEHELDSGSVMAVRDALIAEVTAETQRISREIQSGDLGKKAIESRKNEAALLKKKVEDYESILDVTLDHLKKGLDCIDQSQALARSSCRPIHSRTTLRSYTMPAASLDDIATLDQLAARQAAGETAHRAITAARTRLILGRDGKSVFFATLALRLRVEVDWSCPTMAVDGKTLFYNPAFVNGLAPDELVGVLCHETCHLALAHHCRRGNRDMQRWNEACDLATNPLLLRSGIRSSARKTDAGRGALCRTSTG